MWPLLAPGYSAIPTTVSVSPDGTNWAFVRQHADSLPSKRLPMGQPKSFVDIGAIEPNQTAQPGDLFDRFRGQTVSSALDQFAGSAGGTGYNLLVPGFPWIQYVRVQPGPGAYTVIDSIAAVNPTVEGDTLTVTANDVDAGITNLAFQSPGDPVALPLLRLVSIQSAPTRQSARWLWVGFHHSRRFREPSSMPVNYRRPKVQAPGMRRLWRISG